MDGMGQGERWNPINACNGFILGRVDGGRGMLGGQQVEDALAVVVGTDVGIGALEITISRRYYGTDYNEAASTGGGLSGITQS